MNNDAVYESLRDVVDDEKTRLKITKMMEAFDNCIPFGLTVVALKLRGDQFKAPKFPLLEDVKRVRDAAKAADRRFLICYQIRRKGLTHVELADLADRFIILDVKHGRAAMRMDDDLKPMH